MDWRLRCFFSLSIFSGVNLLQIERDNIVPETLTGCCVGKGKCCEQSCVAFRAL
jgi:hypothetical protein